VRSMNLLSFLMTTVPYGSFASRPTQKVLVVLRISTHTKVDLVDEVWKRMGLNEWDYKDKDIWEVQTYR
jgi:hypothetical protein